MYEFWLAAVGTVVGGIITFATSYWLYVRAAKELREEARLLRAQGNAIFGAVINPDAKRSAKEDSQGNTIGVIVEAVANTSRKNK